MFPFRPALAALLLLGGPPGAADITLSISPRAAGSGDHDLKELPESFCVIL